MIPEMTSNNMKRGIRVIKNSYRKQKSFLKWRNIIPNETGNKVTPDNLAAGIKTLCVRIGFNLGVKLYYWLVAMIYLVSALLYQAQILPGLILILVTGVVLWQPLKLLNASKQQRIHLTPLTGRFYFLYSTAYLLTIWIPQL